MNAGLEKFIFFYFLHVPGRLLFHTVFTFYMIKNSFILLIALGVLQVFVGGCVDPVTPEYDFQDDLLFIDAFALSEPGFSSVSIKKSFYDQRDYRSENVSNAVVQLKNPGTGAMVEFVEESPGVYAGPPDFTVGAGEVWKLYITLQDGRRVESKPDTVAPSVAIDSVGVAFSPEVKFDIGFDRYIPGHSVRLTWQDPPGQPNYYLWKYRTYEPQLVCKTCIRGIYRDGRCQALTSGFIPPYYDYLCDPACWLIRYGEELPTFDDRLSDGAQIVGREIAVLPYYRRQDVLIQIQQLSLSESSYAYYQVINNLISESSGLNAPPPAALLGNLFNPDDPDEFILGQFSAAAISTRNVYIDRSDLPGVPLTPDPIIRTETCIGCPVSYPCEESRFRTSTKPAGWP